MSRIVLRNCLRPSLLTRGPLAHSLAGPRSHRHREHEVTNRNRKVQVGMTNRQTAVSHHLQVVRHAVAGTPDDQRNRKGVVRPAMAVAMGVEAAPAPVRAHPIRMRRRTRSNNSPALSGVAGETQRPGGTKRRNSNVLRCPNRADTEPGKMRSSRTPPQPQGGLTIRRSSGSKLRLTKPSLWRI
jgi:hypothetical protein